MDYITPAEFEDRLKEAIANTDEPKAIITYLVLRALITNGYAAGVNIIFEWLKEKGVNDLSDMWSPNKSN